MNERNPKMVAFVRRQARKRGYLLRRNPDRAAPNRWLLIFDTPEARADRCPSWCGDDDCDVREAFACGDGHDLEKVYRQLTIWDGQDLDVISGHFDGWITFSDMGGAQ